MIQQEVIELIERLNQERLYVGAEVKAIAKLNEEVSHTAAEAFKTAWVAQQQRRNLAALIQNETKSVSCCKRAALLESTIFIDGYKLLNQHEPKYGEWLVSLRSDPALLACQLLQAERLSHAAAAATTTGMGATDSSSSSSGAASELASVLLSAVFGCCVLRSDEAAVAEMLLALARNAYGSSNSSNVHRRSSSMFHLMFTQYVECLPSVRLFLTSALQPAVMLLLMKDDSQYDLDPQKTHHSYLAARRPPSRSSLPRAGDNPVTLDRETMAAASARHRTIVAQQMVEVLRCLISSIRHSLHCFPPALLWLVNRIYHGLMQNEGCTHDTARAACTDVVFESFICPALLNAAAHGLTLDAQVSSMAQHNLTEVARILRILAHSRSRQIGSLLQPSVGTSVAAGDDVLSHVDKDGLGDIIDALITKNAPEKPPFASKDVHGISRTAALVTLTDLRRLVAFQRAVAQSFPEGDATRLRTEQLLLELPPLPPAAAAAAALPPSSLAGQSAAVNQATAAAVASSATPPGTPPVSRTKLGKKPTIVGASIAVAAAVATPASAASSPQAPQSQSAAAAADVADSKPEEVLVITLHSASQEIGLMAENKVLALAEEHANMSNVVTRRHTADGEGLVKRTRFSLTAATAHSGGLGDASELGDVISEAASVHSVGSTTLDNDPDMAIDQDADDDDDLSDMVSANVSGRGSPNVSGRDTPQSGAGVEGDGSGGGGGADGYDRGSESTGCGRRRSGGSSRPPLVANIPVTIKKAEEDLPDRFGMFDIRSQMNNVAPGAAGGDLEVRSTMSDTWSTDVLGGSDVGGVAGAGADDDEDDDTEAGSRRQLQHRLLEVDDDGLASAAAQNHPQPPPALPQPPQQQQRPLSAGMLTLGSFGGGASETASESAWSTDVLAASDTSERPSERLRELDNIDEQLHSMGFSEATGGRLSRANIDDVDSVTSENSDDLASSDGGSSSDHSSTDRQDVFGTLRPRRSILSKHASGQSELAERSTEAQQRATSSPTSTSSSGLPAPSRDLSRDVPLADYRTSEAAGASVNAATTSSFVMPPAASSGILTATPLWRQSSIPSASKSADVMELFDPLAGPATSASRPGASAAFVVAPSASRTFPSWPESLPRSGLLGSAASADALAFSALSSSLPAGRLEASIAGGAGLAGSRPTRPFSSSGMLGPGDFDLLAISNPAANGVRPPSWPGVAMAQQRMPLGGQAVVMTTARLESSHLSGSSNSGTGWSNQEDGPMRLNTWDSLAAERQWKGSSSGAREAPTVDAAGTSRAGAAAKVTSVPNGDEALADFGLLTAAAAATSSPASLAAEEKLAGGDKKRTTILHSLKMTFKGKRKDSRKESSQAVGLDNRLYDVRGSLQSLDDAVVVNGGPAVAGGSVRATSSGGAGVDSVDDILDKYRSNCRRSATDLDRQPSVSSDAVDSLLVVSAAPAGSEATAAAAAVGSAHVPTLDPSNLENCSAFADAKKKLRLVLSSADSEALRHVGSIVVQTGLPQSYDPYHRVRDDDNDIVRLLQILLSQAMSLQSKPVIAQLHETIRCLRLFKQKSACRKLLQAMKEDYRRRVHYISYLTRSRQGLMVSLAHLQQARDLQSRDRDVCQSCFVSECVRIYLHKKERALVELRDGFAQLSAPDEKCNMVERGLETLCQDMDRDAIWQAANEQQLDGAQLAIERRVMAFVYHDAMFPNSDADLERDRIFHESIHKLGQGLTPSHAELKIPAKYHMEFPWKSAQEEIVMLNLYKTPRDKLQCIVCCCKVIMNLLSMAGEERNVPAADDFLPVFICVVVLANPEYLLSTVQYVDSFYGRRMDGEEMYWWMQLKSVVAFITMWMQKETQGIDSALPQRRSVEGSSSGDHGSLESSYC